MLAFITAVRNLVERVLASFPKSSIALATLAAALLSRFGFHVDATQVTSIASAVVLVISILSHYSKGSVEARKTAAPAK